MFASPTNGSQGPPIASAPARPPRLYYGWVVVLCCAIVILVSNGINFSFGVFFTSLQAEFGWTRAATSGLFSIYLLLAGIFAVLQGWALDRYGARLVITLMGCVTGVSLVLTSRAQTSLDIYLSYGVLLSMGTGAMYVLVISAAAPWFVAKRATVTGIIGAFSGLGTVFMSPLAAWLVAAFHWREAYCMIGAGAFATMVPLGLLLQRHPDRPEPLHALGEGATAPFTGRDPFSLRQAIAERPFWLMFTVWLAYAFCLHMVLAHLVPMAEDMGVAPVRAAALLSTMTALAVAGRVLSGVVADRCDGKVVFMTGLLAVMVAVIWLVVASRPWMLFLFAALFGASYGSVDPPIFVIIADTFGVENIGRINGLLMIGWGIGSALGPFTGGLLFDWTGQYRLAFVSAALMLALAAACGRRIQAPGRDTASVRVTA